MNILKFLASILPGFKTQLFAIFTGLLPFISTEADKFVSTHSGMWAAFVTVGVVLLKELGKLHKP